MTEDQIHRAIVAWWDAVGHHRFNVPSRLLFHAANGGRRDVREAALFKARGVRAGIPDLLLLAARGGYHGAAFEVKTPKGRISKAQAECLEELDAAGYYAVVVRSVYEGRREIEHYLLMR